MRFPPYLAAHSSFHCQITRATAVCVGRVHYLLRETIYSTVASQAYAHRIALQVRLDEPVPATAHALPGPKTRVYRQRWQSWFPRHSPQLCPAYHILHREPFPPSHRTVMCRSCCCPRRRTGSLPSNPFREDHALQRCSTKRKTDRSNHSRGYGSGS